LEELTYIKASSKRREVDDDLILPKQVEDEELVAERYRDTPDPAPSA
jgi:hypothetical protein